MSKLDVAKREINRWLTSVVGFNRPVYTMPFRAVDISTACITPTEILISKDIIDKNPKEAVVYFAHEIFHPVIEEPIHSQTVNSQVLNTVEDYVINAYLYDLFGFDVRKVSVRGLFNLRLGRLGLTKALRSYKRAMEKDKNPDLVGKVWSHQPRGAHHFHPDIIRCVDHIRRKYNFTRPKDAILFDLIDRETYLEAIGSDIKELCFRGNEQAIEADPYCVSSNVFMHAYKRNPTPSVKIEDSKVASTVETFAWAAEPPESCKDDMLLSAEYAKVVVRNLNQHSLWILSQLQSAVASCSTKKSRMKSAAYSRLRALSAGKRPKVSAASVNALKDSYNRAVKKVERLKLRSQNPIGLALVTNPAKARNRTWFSGPSLASKSNVKKAHGSLPSVYGPWVTMSSVREIVRRANIHLEWITTARQSLDQLSSNLGIPSLQKLAGPTSLPPSIIGEKTGKKNSGMGSGKSDGGENQPEQSDDQGQGQGQGQGSERTITKQLSANPKVINEIINNVLVEYRRYLSLLSSTPRQRQLDDESSYDLGNDLPKADLMELGKLGNELTRLLVYKDIAESSLLVEEDYIDSRPPISVLIDMSGSMSGDRYAKAVGLSLALATLLGKKSGVSLIKFDSRPRPALVFTPSKTPTLQELFDYVCTPSYGGTEPVSALDFSVQVAEAENWKSMMSVMITDGDFLIEDVSEWRQSQTRSDQHMVALVTKVDGNQYVPAFDRYIDASKSVDVIGNSIMSHS